MRDLSFPGIDIALQKKNITFSRKIKGIVLLCRSGINTICLCPSANIKFKLQSWVNFSCPINPRAPLLNWIAWFWEPKASLALSVSTRLKHIFHISSWGPNGNASGSLAREMQYTLFSPSCVCVCVCVCAHVCPYSHYGLWYDGV